MPQFVDRRSGASAIEIVLILGAVIPLALAALVAAACGRGAKPSHQQAKP